MSNIMLKGLSLSGQVACAERELTRRRSGYPGMVSRARMKQGEAEYEIAAQEAVVKSLRWLAKYEPAIRARVVAAGGEDLEEGSGR